MSRSKDRYKQLRDQGLCYRCGQPATESNGKCLKCYTRDQKGKQKRLELLICENCGDQIDSNRSHRKCSKCLDKENAKQDRQKARKTQKLYRDKRKSSSKCVSCGGKHGKKLPNQQRCSFCKERGFQRHVKYWKKLKDQVFKAYGGYICSCCGEMEPAFLTIDHINNDGAEHRKTVDGSHLYLWLRQNHFPKGFQVLCANCNFSKGRPNSNGACPHQNRKLFPPEYII